MQRSWCQHALQEADDGEAAGLTGFETAGELGAVVVAQRVRGTETVLAGNFFVAIHLDFVIALAAEQDATHFDAALTDAFKDRFGELLIATGYEKDLDWRIGPGTPPSRQAARRRPAA